MGAGKEAKKSSKERTPSKKWEKYKIEGDKIIRSRSCPRCGPGIFLAVSSNRLYCGKCHYTSFDKEEIKTASK